MGEPPDEQLCWEAELQGTPWTPPTNYIFFHCFRRVSLNSYRIKQRYKTPGGP